MDKIHEILEAFLNSLDVICHSAITENIGEIKENYVALVGVINELIQLQLKGGLSIDTTLLNKMEILYQAMVKGDFIKIIDVTMYEMKPILYRLESLGE